MKSFLARQRGRLRQARAIAAARGGWFRCAARALRIFYLHGGDGLRLAWRRGAGFQPQTLSPPQTQAPQESASPGKERFNRLRAFISELELIIFMLRHTPRADAPGLSASGPPAGPPDDAALVHRIMAAYKHGHSRYAASEGFWDAWTTGLKKDIHEALLGGDAAAVAAIFHNPGGNVLMLGFDTLVNPPKELRATHSFHASPIAESKLNEHTVVARLVYDGLVTFAEMLGARRLENPAQWRSYVLNPGQFPSLSVDDLLAAIEERLGLTISFPNPFPKERGLPSKRGIISYRAIQALYQAWRIREIVGSAEARILEIGAGLGRTAYFGRLLGLNNYTIVDIPMTNAAQIYFLSRVLGEDLVKIGPAALACPQGLRILSVPDFQGAENENYDLVFNCDSLTEMTRPAAENYFHFARRQAKAFLSINHESNAFTFYDLYSSSLGEGASATRNLYPMRQGYMEELIKFG